MLLPQNNIDNEGWPSFTDAMDVYTLQGILASLPRFNSYLQAATVLYFLIWYRVNS